jgi:hypothetical protein
MSLRAPNLDNRSFDQMVEESRNRIRELCPQWTDTSPSDPGFILLELFAYLNDAMIYQLNRLPEKAYVEFLRLIGVTVSPPSAAVVNLKFTVPKAAAQPIEIPGGTKVTISRSGAGQEPPVFSTAKTVVIEKNATEVEVMAYQCEWVDAELAGKGTGTYGLSVAVKRPPIVASIKDGPQILVGVETPAKELADRPDSKKFEEKAYRIWEEVPNFSNLEDGDKKYVYTVDRVTGTISFAPQVQLKEPKSEQIELIGRGLAEKPLEGKEIRVWYCRGGGAQGNVSRDTLTVMKTPIPGVSVTNPAAATGGRDTESLQNALLRGPKEFHSLQRAVTASDFELLAKRGPGVERAKAFTRADLWVHALPGTVEVLLVPEVPKEQRSGDRVDIQSLQERETDEAKKMIFNALEEKRPLGTSTMVNWVRYKKVSASARAVMRHGSDKTSLKERILNRLYAHINPLPTETSNGWEFGEPLRVSHIFDIVLKEPDVRYVEDVALHLDEVPATNISSLAADAFQPNTWYSSTGNHLFRSMDNGNGWELIKTFDSEEIQIINCNKNQAGMTAVVTTLPNNSSRLYVSEDCGESWRGAAQTADFLINDVSWTMRNNLPLLMVATDKGLYELQLQPDASLVPLEVDPQKRELGFYAVTASIGIRGTFYVAVAARNLGGVYLSAQGGRKESFVNIGLQKEDIRVLRIQQDGVRTYLWAGITVAGNEPGKGCFRWELQGSEPPTGGTKFQKNWDGGSCHGLAFKGPNVYAATHDKGVLWLDPKGEAAAWNVPKELNIGLPVRDAERVFQPVNEVAAHPEGTFVMAGGNSGIYRSGNDGKTYQSVSNNVFDDKVTLPSTWLLVSGEHQIEVVSEDEAKRD